MSTPLQSPLLTAPYVSVAEFKASPTWLGLDDLIEGGTDAQQDAELYNQLLKASAWADNFIRQPLRAHYQVDNLVCRVDRRGQIWVHPTHSPIREIVAFSWSADITGDFQVINPTSGQVWIQDGKGTILALSGIGAIPAGMQLGAPPAASTQLYVQVEYVAGYGHGVVVEADAASTSITVDSTLGFTGPQVSKAGNSFGASAARIWDPAQEEALTIASVDASDNELTFTTATQYAHDAGVNVSELPAEVKQAVTQYAAGLLLREDVTNDLPFSGAPGPSARRSEGRGVAGGLINEAECSLRPYRRVR